jgi:hypothetical protein
MKFDLRHFGEFELSDNKLKSGLTVGFEFILKRFQSRWEKLSAETQKLLLLATDTGKEAKLGKNEDEIKEFLTFVVDELENRIKHMDSFYSGELNKYLQKSLESPSADVVDDKKKIQELIDSIEDDMLRMMWKEEMAHRFDPAFNDELSKLKDKLGSHLKANKFMDAIDLMKEGIGLAKSINESKKYIEIVEGLFKTFDDKVNPTLVKTFSPQNEQNLKTWVIMLREKAKFLDLVKFDYLRNHKAKVLESVIAMEDAIIENLKAKDSNFTRKVFEDKKSTILAQVDKK